MFTALVSRFRNEIDDLKEVMLWQDTLRTTINAAPGNLETIPLDAASLEALQERAPNRVTWQVYDHCASISRVYALFENVICSLVNEYVSYLPRTTPAYQNLNERLRIQHRTGIGLILTKWSETNPLYQNLREGDIASGLTDGLRQQPYSILGDAFLVSPENFRTGALTRLFGDLGFDHALGFVSKTESIREFLKINLAGAETLDSFLDSLVRIRNEASHGSVGSIASVKELLDYAEFSYLIVDALALLLRTQVIRAGVNSDCAQLLGFVAHKFSNNIVGILSSFTGAIKIGEKLYAGKKALTDVKVISLKILNEDRQIIDLTPGLEFGLKIDKPIPLGAELLRWIV